jgi:hypothetical protein
MMNQEKRQQHHTNWLNHQVGISGQSSLPHPPDIIGYQSNEITALDLLPFVVLIDRQVLTFLVDYREQSSRYAIRVVRVTQSQHVAKESGNHWYAKAQTNKHQSGPQEIKANVGVRLPSSSCEEKVIQ